MPKQSGIHQIKGKLGTVSYYGRKYSNTGFLRSINQEVGERVKTAENYAGTREQNEYFKRAAGAAWCVLNGIPNRSYFFTRNDLNGQLQKFFRENYSKISFPVDDTPQKVRWRGLLPGFFMGLQKNNFSVFEVLGTKGGYDYTTYHDTNEYALAVQFELEFDRSRIDLYYPTIDEELSYIYCSVFGVSGEGKDVVQLQHYETFISQYVFQDGLSIDLERRGNNLLPHASYTDSGGGLFLCCVLVPNIGGVNYISKASMFMCNIPMDSSILS